MLPEATITVGRDEGCDIRLSSGRVSRQHCTLQITERGLLLTDLGSRNGTFVNEQSVVGSRLLRTGDLLRVGPWEFRIAGSHTGVAVRPGDQETSEDEIANWLGTETESPSDPAMSGGDTTLIPRMPSKPKFQSVAEEAADIIRRHMEAQGENS